MDKSTYFNSPYLSQSDLKRVIGKPYDNPSEVGNLVDMMCTERESMGDYLVSKSKITPSMKVLWTMLLKEGIYDPSPRQAFIINKGAYGKGKYTEDRVFNELMKFEDFRDEYLTDKIIVTPTEWYESERMADIIFNHPRTQFLKEAETQVAILNDNFYGHKVKGLLDYRMPNKRVVDLKSVYSMGAHMKNFYKFRYDLQTTWYSDISGSKELPMIVFVAPDADYPIVIKLKPETMLMARVGGHKVTETFIVNGKKYPQKKYVYGYLDLLTQYEKLKSNNFTYPPNDYETIINGYKEI